jgi:hypothetical protein
MNPEIEHVLQFFEFGHLPDRLANVSRPFCELAHLMANHLPDSPEVIVFLRKLLESKDAAVRAELLRSAD